MSLCLAKTAKRFQSMRSPLLQIATTVASCPRCYSGRVNCAKDESPRCSPEKMANVTCESKLDSKWFDPKCCLEPCPDAMPRFDELYYKPSNKHRKFTRTWVECPKERIVRKKVCCYEVGALPPIERRPSRSKCATECKTGPDSAKLMKCHVSKNQKCPKWILPGCKSVRDPPRCFQLRRPANCKKVCTPFPAFSECKRPKPPKRHPSECGCLLIRAVCPNELNQQK